VVVVLVVMMEEEQVLDEVKVVWSGGVVRAAAKSTSDGVRTHASYLRQKYFRWGSNPACLLPAYMFYMYKLRTWAH
jgi:hypothetical protein